MYQYDNFCFQFQTFSTKMCDNSETILQLQAEQEFEREDWEWKYNLQKQEIEKLKTDNQKLSLDLSQTKSRLQAQMEVNEKWLKRIKEESDKKNELKTSR